MASSQQISRLSLITDINRSRLSNLMPGRWKALGPMFFSIFVILTLVIVALAKLLSPESVDVFEAYHAIMPGQTTDALESHKCNSPYEDTEDGASFCQIHPKDEAMLLVTVTSQNGIITTVAFAPDGLRFGDLVLHWGRPSTIQEGNEHAVARWEEGVFATTTTGKPFTFNTPVQTIVISAADYCECDLTAFTGS